MRDSEVLVDIPLMGTLEPLLHIVAWPRQPCSSGMEIRDLDVWKMGRNERDAGGYFYVIMAALISNQIKQFFVRSLKLKNVFRRRGISRVAKRVYSADPRLSYMISKMAKDSKGYTSVYCLHETFGRDWAIYLACLERGFNGTEFIQTVPQHILDSISPGGQLPGNVIYHSYNYTMMREYMTQSNEEMLSQSGLVDYDWYIRILSVYMSEETEFVAQSGLTRNSKSKLCREARNEVDRKIGAMEQRLVRHIKKAISQSRAVKRDNKYRAIMKAQAGFGDFFGIPHNVRVDVGQETNANLERFLKVMQEFPIDKISAAFETLKQQNMSHTFEIDWIKPIALIGLATAGFMCVWDKPGAPKWRLVMLACATPLAASTGYALFREYMERYDPSNMEAQMSQDAISKIAGLLFMGLSAMSVGTTLDARTFERACVKMSLFDKVKGGLTEALMFALTLFEKAINYIRGEWLGWDKISLISKDIPTLKKWCEEVEMVVDLQHGGDLTLNTETAAIVYRLEKEGRLLESMKCSQSDALQIRTAVGAYKRALRALVSKFEASNMNGNGTRMVPAAFLVIGGTDVGKSTKADPLMRRLILRTLPEEQHELIKKNFYDYVYALFPEHEYWDAYRQQFLVLMDDAFQTIDVAGNPDNEYLKVIRMVNSVPYICHMAAIESKGNTPFTSKIVYATSNMTRINPHSIYAPEAVARRFDVIVRCVPKRQFARGEEEDPLKRRLNTDHPHLKGVEWADDVHEYHIVRVAQNGTGELITTGEVLQEEELLEKMAGIYHRKVADFERYQRHLNKVMDPIQMVEVEDPLVVHEAPLDYEKLSPLEYMREYYELRKFGISAEEVVELSGSDDILEFWLQDYARGDTDACDAAFELWKESETFQGLRRDVCRLPKKVMSSMASAKVVIESSIQAFGQRVEKFESDLSQNYPVLRSFLNVLPILAGFATGYKLTTSFILPYMNQGKEVKAEPDVKTQEGLYDPEAPMDSEAYKMRSKSRLNQSKPKNATVMQAEALFDTNSFEMSQRVMQRNQYSLHVGNLKRVGLATFVRGRTLMIPNHFIFMMRALIEEGSLSEGDFVTLKNLHVKDTLKVSLVTFLDPKNHYRPGSEDLIFVNLPSVVHHPDITNYFITEEQVEKPFDWYLTLVGMDSENNAMRFNGPAEKILNKKMRVSTDEMVIVARSFMYMSQTSPGDCGFLSMVSNNSIGPGKIVGYHVAGSDNGWGMSTVVTKEMAMAGVSHFKDKDFPPPNVLKSQCCELPFSGDFIPLGKLDKPVGAPNQTKYIPGPLQGCLGPVNRFPAILKNTDGINPLVKAIDAYGMPKVAPNIPLIRRAVKALTAKFVKVRKGFRKLRVLSFEEACKGISEVEYMNAVPRQTSAGYPYVLDPKPGYRGKEWYFGKGEEYDFTRPQAIELKREVTEIIEKAKRGERGFFPYIDTKKDELRKQSKIDNMETRLVSALALALLIVGRMYYMDFSVFVMERNMQLGIGVGVNPYSNDWDILARALQSVGDKCVAGDHSGFDTRCYADLYEELLPLINLMYEGTEEEDFIRKVLLVDLYNSIHIFGDVVYQWVSCMPSGHFLTAIMNSLVNLVLLRMCWFTLESRAKLEYEPVYEDEVMDVVYGDDVIMNVSDAVSSWFNQLALTSAMAEIGFVFTDDQKSTNIVEFRTLEECTFLKRYFRFEPMLSRFVAPLEFDSIKKSIDWGKRSANFLGNCKQAVDKALVEFALHKREDFSKWSKPLLAASKEILQHEVVDCSQLALLQKACKLEMFY